MKSDRPEDHKGFRKRVLRSLSSQHGCLYLIIFTFLTGVVGVMVKECTRQPDVIEPDAMWEAAERARAHLQSIFDGISRMDQGDYPGAIAAFDDYINKNKSDPAHRLAYALRGKTLYEWAMDQRSHGMAEAARLKLIEAVASLDSCLNYRYADSTSTRLEELATLSLAETWFNRGTCLFELERYHDAVESFEEAISCDRGYADAWLMKGRALLALGSYSEARACYDSCEAYRR